MHHHLYELILEQDDRNLVFSTESFSICEQIHSISFVFHNVRYIIFYLYYLLIHGLKSRSSIFCLQK
ncbi:hypothetical protein AR158_c520R [Paramecium bursaria Chlorella virus AR158]|uniref:hypothetical protein n=1 Tax=Paramecium bursaria Chlorella virus AR158 TaxID=380598 RepID=UPI00015AA736|nr:hypothetical protein AR158_c520R [Paramecium bursaria Chlorella virus AR158]ABU44065.1 hypothetical protein AR158_c520R [Paramecium bursaria Chlorella virus AR158]